MTKSPQRKSPRSTSGKRSPPASPVIRHNLLLKPKKRQTRKERSSPAAARHVRPEAASSSPPIPEESRRESPALTEEEMDLLQTRRLRSLEALIESQDLATIHASLTLVNQLHVACELHPSAVTLVNDAGVASRYLMYQSLMEQFTRPMSFGGLAYSDTKAKGLITHLFNSIGPSFWTSDFDQTELEGAGLSKLDSRKTLPHLRIIGEEIRTKLENIRRVVFSE
jgi:hypothetical protein